MFKEILADYNPKHSKYQIDNYIIKMNGITLYGQYKQALREMMPRYKAILELRIKILECIEPKKDCLNDIQVLKSRLEAFKQAEMELKMKALIKEFKRFYQIAVACKKQLGDIDVDKEEALYWEKSFKARVCLELLTTGNIKNNTLETVLSMPGDCLNFLASIRKNIHQAAAYLETCKVDVPELEEISDIELQHIIYEGDNLLC